MRGDLYHDEYLDDVEFKHLVGRRAKIKNNLEGYSRKLWNAKGKITRVNDNLFLKFDKPIKTGGLGDKGMSGVYLKEGSFDLL